MLKRWDCGDLSEHQYPVSYPAKVLLYAQERFSELKKTQNRLLAPMRSYGAFRAELREPSTTSPAAVVDPHAPEE